VSFDRAFIGTGARPAEPPVAGLSENSLSHSHQCAGNWITFPRGLVVIGCLGGGPSNWRGLCTPRQPRSRSGRAAGCCHRKIRRCEAVEAASVVRASRCSSRPSQRGEPRGQLFTMADNAGTYRQRQLQWSASGRKTQYRQNLTWRPSALPREAVAIARLTNIPTHCVGPSNAGRLHRPAQFCLTLARRRW